MLKVAMGLLSMTFFFGTAHASSTMFKNGVCHFNNKDYILYSPKAGGISNSDAAYIVIEKRAGQSKLPDLTEAKTKKGSPYLQFPPVWHSLQIPLSQCTSQQLPENEIIREFYLKTYFIAGEPSELKEDIDTLVKKGLAIPLKVRALCKSDDFSEDISFCYEVTILDDVIPL